MSEVEKFKVVSSPMTGLFVLKRHAVVDARGSFQRLFSAEVFRDWGVGGKIPHINWSQTSMKGAVRGLHFQYPPYAEDKIVTCLQGSVFDVAVDLRQNSPTFLQWHGELLSEENARMVLIPKGFALGFQTLDDDCRLLYFHTEVYNAEAESGINSQDSTISINWPLPVTQRSERDAALPSVEKEFKGIAL